ncbi:MAG: S8 family peptidase [Acidobacteria bacterium]|nr:S8 family peptidase [Acidobacteriota bacterium]
MDFAPQQPKLGKFLISPPVREEMAIQRNEMLRAINPVWKPIPVIITLNDSGDKLNEGLERAKTEVKRILEQQNISYRESEFYLFAALTPDQLDALAERRKWIHRIWMDETTYAHLLQSTETIKATACWRTFQARGSGIVWAVMDTGISQNHPHFDGILRKDISYNFSNSLSDDDLNGHGSHVAGIISGAAKSKSDGSRWHAATYVEEQEEPAIIDLPDCISGVAPLTQLVSIKVLDDNGTGTASNAILGLEYLRKLNRNSRSIVIDGVNMSLGYPFDPKWYSCGHSPLCEEVRRTVESGIIVVISCGNSGYGFSTLDDGTKTPIWLALSISDPANTEDAISVGSVHKCNPHTYGISYFSSKGPTGDGRHKPDLVAPGERVISVSVKGGANYEYEERSGTSMAAPHVSGAISAFLSVHHEFRGSPKVVKELFAKSATDLGRSVDFQGAGMIDLLRTIMSV